MIWQGLRFRATRSLTPNFFLLARHLKPRPKPSERSVSAEGIAEHQWLSMQPRRPSGTLRLKGLTDRPYDRHHSRFRVPERDVSMAFSTSLSLQHRRSKQGRLSTLLARSLRPAPQRDLQMLVLANARACATRMTAVALLNRSTGH
ncbi:hypothetical protein BAUCODRAFT_196796 [Baudoinia panamericana UAMH 10762]|uniref:Uncharacterized protein n=1 Tax=Baudoinia panamericana (strain UAMH 10762) TaxID=717646 RepID=M2M212_BAUPA|nr:uncharacterized protein BAUCODRAFT_196796 [Baudoinia panamericana UAMH 10762]EMD01118.1 hypothetical protein BAUCODRAFT_196796 [Baudoinia panamericana UAMH 10762]